MTKPAQSEVSVQSTLRGWSVEFDDYFVSVYPTDKSTKSLNDGYAACRRIAKAAEFSKAAGYDDLTEWAKATVKLQDADNAGFMQDDVWGFWHDWRDSLDRAAGSEFTRFAAWPNHLAETVSVDVEFKSNEFVCDGYKVEVRRVYESE